MKSLSLCSWTSPVSPFRKTFITTTTTPKNFKFRVTNCNDPNRDDAPLSSTSSAYAVLGLEPTCSPADLKAAFRAKVVFFFFFPSLIFVETQYNFIKFLYNYLLKQVKQFHPDVNRTGEGSDTMIRRVIQAYEVVRIIFYNSHG